MGSNFHPIKMKPYQLASDFTDGQPIRKLRRGRRGTHIVHFPSIKNERVVVCESRLEADFALSLEFDPDIESYIPQPETFEIFLDGRSRRYTPDFLTIARSGARKYWEVKPDGAVENAGLMRLIEAVRNFAHQRNTSFDLVKSAWIRRDPFLSNMKQIYSKAHVASPESIEFMQHTFDENHGALTYGQLRELPGPPSFAALARMIVSNRVAVDFHQPLGLDTTLTLGRGLDG
jgi:TnsA endonuclease N terminal